MNRPAKPLLLVLLLSVSPSTWAAVCRVSADGTAGNDGSTWGLATTLQSALANGNGKSCAEIWVKGGVYKPTSGADRTISFSINRQLKLYGGFAGTEATLADRTPATLAAHPSVLSGDIDNNDTVDASGVDVDYQDIIGNNSFHVVVIGGTTSIGNGVYTPLDTLINGMVISGGAATGAIAPDNVGGGLYCNGRPAGKVCSPAISDSSFSGNRAGFGGAIYNVGFAGGTSSPVLSGVLLHGNHADSDGGAIFNEGNSGTSSPIVSDTSFTDNSAGLDGGALFNNGYNSGISSPILSNVGFHANSAASSGGAMYNNGDQGGSNPTLNNTEFSGNHATLSGGAMYNFGNLGASNPTLTGVSFSGNVASNFCGGAMANIGSGSGGESSPVLDGATFTGNSANQGGAMCNSVKVSNGTSSPNVRNATFSGNSATSTIGGAIYNDLPLVQSGTMNPTLTNVTFSGNTGANGSVAYNSGPYIYLTLVNAILVKSSSGLFFSTFQNSTMLEHSVVYDTTDVSTCPANATCTDMHYEDPKLGALADNGGPTWTMLPATDSVAIDNGDDVSCPSTDQRGIPRPQGSHCDIGAVELSDVIFANGFQEQ